MKLKFLLMALVVVLFIGSFCAGASEQLEEDNISATDAPEITANQPQKNKTLYLYSVDRAVDVGNRTTKQIYNTTKPNNNSVGNAVKDSNFKAVADWYLYPQLAGNLTLKGWSNISMWARKTVGTGSVNVKLYYSLYEITPQGEKTLIADNNGEETVTFADQSWREVIADVYINETTVSPSSTIKVEYSLWGNSNNNFSIAWGNQSFNSRLNLPCMNYINVDNVYTMDYEDNVTNIFSPESSNKDIYLRAEITDPFGGYDIEWVNLTLYAPNGTVINGLNETSMNKIYGYFNSYRSVFEIYWNYTGYPKGLYDVSVKAVDKNGLYSWEYNGDFGGHDVYGSHQFLISSMKYYVNLKIVDDHNDILPNTTVLVKPEDGTKVLINNNTDEEGITNVSLTNISYTINVVWQDVEVSVNRTVNVTELGNRTRENPYILKAKVVYPSFKILDSRNNQLSDSKVYLTHPNGTASVDPYRTNEQGEISLLKTAEGKYSLEVIWKGRSVGSKTVFVNDSTTYDVNVDVYYLDLKVNDNSGEAVSNALVVFVYNDTGIAADSKMTDQEGNITVKLPGTLYNIEVYWKDAEVYGETLDLTNSLTHSITASIYNTQITVLDSMNKPVSGAEITSTYLGTGRTISSKTTDTNGKVRMRLAEGEHEFNVTWLGEYVGDKDVYIDADNKDITVQTDVYHVRVIAKDNTTEEDILVNATVSVDLGGDTIDSGTTNEKGVYVSVLPKSTVDIKILWKGTEVYNETGINILENENKTAICEVYILEISLVDSHAEPVENANIGLYKENSLIGVKMSDNYGNASIRLPVDFYDIEAEWKGILVASESYQMVKERENNSIRISSDVYYLNLSTLDNEGITISDVSIEVKLGEEIILSDKTGNYGSISTRLPGETYEFTFSWRGFIVNSTSIQIDSDKEIDAEMQIYNVTFTPLDSHNNTVENAEISIRYEGESFGSGRTGEDGDFNILIPREEFDVSVKWEGLNVYKSAVNINDSSDVKLHSDIYYLSLRGTDSHDNPLENITVSIYHSELLEGQNLITTVTIKDEKEIRIPRGTINLKTKWRGFDVASSNIDVENDRDFEINCNVNYLDISVKDSEGKLLNGAKLLVETGDGEIFTTIKTEEGTAVPKLPVEDWLIQAYWKGEQVAEEEIIDFSQDESLEIITDVHYIRLKVEGSVGGIKGAEVSLVDDTGNIVAFNKTDSSGEIVLEQIIQGDYKLNVKVKKTQSMTDIDLNKNENIDLDESKDINIKFDNYPRPFYSTNLFYFILVFLLVIITGTALIMRKMEVI